jgi:hypothetical protein
MAESKKGAFLDAISVDMNEFAWKVVEWPYHDLHWLFRKIPIRVLLLLLAVLVDVLLVVVVHGFLYC